MKASPLTVYRNDCKQASEKTMAALEDGKWLYLEGKKTIRSIRGWTKTSSNFPLTVFEHTIIYILSLDTTRGGCI